jgi:hypothetical protein
LGGNTNGRVLKTIASSGIKKLGTKRLKNMSGSWQGVGIHVKVAHVLDKLYGGGFDMKQRADNYPIQASVMAEAMLCC